jgi:hypothetical protein
MNAPHVRLPKGVVISSGKHNCLSDGMCALELVDFLDRKRKGGEVKPSDVLSDHPGCVSPLIGDLLRGWNDRLRSDAERRIVLGPLVPLLLDTVGTAEHERTRAFMLIDWSVRELAPVMLDCLRLGPHAKTLRGLLPIVDGDSAVAAVPACKAARSAALVLAFALALDLDLARDRDLALALDLDHARALALALDLALARARALDLDLARALALALDLALARARDLDRAELSPTAKALVKSAQALVRRMCAVSKGGTS